MYTVCFDTVNLLVLFSVKLITCRNIAILTFYMHLKF